MEFGHEKVIAMQNRHAQNACKMLSGRKSLLLTSQLRFTSECVRANGYKRNCASECVLANARLSSCERANAFGQVGASEYVLANAC
eukprot:6208321-Pleurochrysis_carterae.AAC.1